MGSQGLQQTQKLTQQLVLAPQLRQSLKILQVPALELRSVILEELETNPTLDELSTEGQSLEELADRSSADGGESGDGEGAPEASDEMSFDDEDFSILQRLDEDWREHFAQSQSSQVFTAEDAERRQHFFDSVVSETSLQEHLIRQAELVEMSEGCFAAIQYLIGSLDDKGFLTADLQDLANVGQFALADGQEALATLKTFDPPGIGCRDMPECLLEQLAMKGRRGSLAYIVVEEHFKLLRRHRIPEIARKTGASISQVQAAIEEISELDPYPGRKFGEDTNRVIVPDVRVDKDGENWVITLNSDFIPRLRLSNTYKDLIAQGKLSAKEKEYIRDKMRSGKFLINSIEQRQRTIERITKEILHFQADFFEQGVSHLRPLTMNQVAERVGVHETTVSRAIANKYLDTPYGVFEFKYFFTPGYQSNNGESVSNTSIKELIASIIESEDPGKPFSDQQIVGILKEKDIQIARRTVAKYREELGILPTNLRRRYR